MPQEFIIIIIILQDELLDDTNLQEILELLHDGHFSNHSWDYLGLELEIPYDTLGTIENERPTAHDRLKEVLSIWLKRGGATWDNLAYSLCKIEEYKAASE